ncbi:MAG: FAD-dependent oxidoreductase [Candidatus Izemoplasmataceae bacterium]
MNLRKDLLPIFKKHNLIFNNMVKESEEVYTFNFMPKNPINWMAGQHAIFIINHKKIHKPIRPFSIASSPTEKLIKISVKIPHRPSEFKQALLDLNPGDEIIMRGPVGGFYIKNEKPTLFITGGIGVTPYRSMVKQLLDKNTIQPATIDMLYMDSSKLFLYKNNFDAAKDHIMFNIHYLSNRESFHKNLETYAKANKNNANYFLTGSKAMVNSTMKQLKTFGIKKKHIIKDTFIGY